MEAELTELREQGYVVLPDLLSTAELDEMRAALAPLLQNQYPGRNNFEGHRTERVYSLVARHPRFAALVEHPRVLALCDRLLQPNYLLTASQAIKIHPGETPQPFHTDDGFYLIPRPRQAVSISTIVAVDAFTADNGATQLVRGSHLWGDDRVGNLLAQIDFSTAGREGRAPLPARPLTGTLREQTFDLILPPGAAIVFLGTLVHRGGENRSTRPRLALSNQYCQPWARQQENYTLSIPAADARRLPARVQALLGYSIHPPFMGHANGLHPSRLLVE